MIVLGNNTTINYTSIFSDTNTVILPVGTSLAVGDWVLGAVKDTVSSTFQISVSKVSGLEVQSSIVHTY